MDKQPSEAARNAMYDALVEHDALDLHPRYPTARGVLRIDPLVTILADYAERYAAERERAAYEAARNAVCPRCRRGLAVESAAHADNEWDHIREDGKFGGVCLASAIRALMSEATPCT